MKKFKISTVAVAVYAMLAVVFSSCESEVKKARITQKYEDIEYPVNTQKYEDIEYPVKLHYIERSGMKYMIASGQFGEAGVSIQNLTLDSLQVEFYKRSLK